MNIKISDITDTLTSVEILKNLDIAIIEDIATHIDTDTFTRGELLVEHGQPGERLFFIFGGRVEVINPTHNDFLQNSVTLTRGDVIGEISLLVNTSYTADIIAQAQTTVLYLNRDHFNYLVKKYRIFAEVLSNLITSRMGQSGGINKVGRYELLGKLGQGSMSTVFNAFDCELEREVAIKMLKYHLAFDADFIERFEREAKVIASLNHPNIVNVYEIVAEYSTRFIVMEKLPGQNLSVVQKNNGAFSLSDTRMILSQLAEALQYAHNHGDQGIVHRDIKPSNIVLDQSGKIKLTDFGVAGPPRDQDINIEGTPSYLAPEIINGEAVDYRADIYALGVTAFHMLSGKLPFSAPTLPDLLRMQINQEAPDIVKICPEIDDAMATFIQNSMSKNRDQRDSEWEHIRKILSPQPIINNNSVEDQDICLVLHLQNTSSKKTKRLLAALHQLLQDEQQVYSIEMPGSEKE